MPSFLSDYIHYTSGNECPKNWHFWSGFSCLACALQKRVYLRNGYFTITPQLYTCLVGPQGDKKTTAKNIAYDMVVEALPTLPIGAAMWTCQDIVKNMAADDYERVYTDEHGTQVSHRPLALFVNELKNFMGISPSMMINFLTDIWDKKMFDAGTIKRGLEVIMNPCINILACETPEWIIQNLKLNIISGGFARRVMFILAEDEGKRIPFPEVLQDMALARKRCIEHLRKISTIVGGFQYEPDARDFYSKWYRERVIPSDSPILGYLKSKPEFVLKLAMLIEMSEYSPRLIIRKDSIEEAMAHLELAEITMPKLFLASGRNELAQHQQALLEHIKKLNGKISTKEMNKFLENNMSRMEVLSTIEWLKETDRLIERDHILWLPEKYGELLEKQKAAKSNSTLTLTPPPTPTPTPSSIPQA